MSAKHSDYMKDISDMVDFYRKNFGGKIGDYEIIEGLAQTDFSLVYLCKTPEDKKVVVKEPIHEDYKSSFQRMGEIHKKISGHPNICDYIENIGETKEKIVMGYHNAPTLEELKKKKKKINLEDAIQIYSQVMDALSYTAENDVFHGDVSERNILVYSDNTAKLIDFGISELIEKKEPSELSSYYMRPKSEMGFDSTISPQALLNKEVTLNTSLVAHYVTCFQFAKSFYRSVYGDGLVNSPGWCFSDFSKNSKYSAESLQQLTRIVKKATVDHKSSQLNNKSNLNKLQEDEKAYFSISDMKKDFDKVVGEIQWPPYRRFEDQYNKVLDAIQEGENKKIKLPAIKSYGINSNIEGIINEYLNLKEEMGNIGANSSASNKFEDVYRIIEQQVFNRASNKLSEYLKELNKRNYLTEEDKRVSMELKNNFFEPVKKAPKEIYDIGTRVKISYITPRGVRSKNSLIE